jgi:hypothetical protein
VSAASSQITPGKLANTAQQGEGKPEAAIARYYFMLGNAFAENSQSFLFIVGSEPGVVRVCT